MNEYIRTIKLSIYYIDFMYREITITSVSNTLCQLTQRIDERFPESSLAKVSHEMERVCEESTKKLDAISQPNYILRVLIAITVLLGISILTYSILNIELTDSKLKTSEMVSLSESIINELILMGAALYFLFTLEARLKRARALKSINELRALSHVIDMHQLTKDPTEIGESSNTASSPKRILTPYKLNRYLDYCSELLSILGKLAAIYGQHFPEPELVIAVNEVENLTNSLSRKIWQKINILQMQYGNKLIKTNDN